MLRIAYMVNHDWAHGMSGVALFVKLVENDWQTRYDCELIEYPYESHGKASEGVALDVKKVPSAKAKYSWWRLMAGYALTLLRDIRYVYSVRSRLKGRVIVTNQFGCELLPVALRIVCPFDKVVAIAHTHPGQDKEAARLLRRMIEKLCCASVSSVIYNSISAKQEWAKKLSRKNVKGTIIHHGLSDPDLVLPSAYPEKNGECVDFVCASRFARWKGHSQLIAAWARAMRKRTSVARQARDHETPKNMRLILVGDGEAYVECKELATELGIDDSVFFLGARENGARYFNGADVAVQLSTEPEAFGLVLLEAMSRSVPVIASNIGGMPEVVKDGLSGVLVEPNDSAQVADAIVMLADDRSMRVSMGAAGHKIWLEAFSAEKMLNKYEEYFDKCNKRMIAGI